MAELGLEQLDIMAWPGISHDNLDSTYVQLWRRVATYAKERGIVMGGYELQVASRGRGAEVDCIHPETGKWVAISAGGGKTLIIRRCGVLDKTGSMTFIWTVRITATRVPLRFIRHHMRLEDSAVAAMKDGRSFMN